MMNNSVKKEGDKQNSKTKNAQYDKRNNRYFSSTSCTTLSTFLCIAAGTGNRACFHFFTSSEDRFYSMLLWMVIEFQVGWNFGALARCAKWWHGFPDKIVIDESVR